mmetsp:Transcript_51607/g.116170  ORF Transcript_51607/g.116170 Transcript_51607/m.116170 type:complete len:278 (-) Transcript_51607:1377-2210(-)
MAQPACRALLRLTRQFLPNRCFSPGWLRYSARIGDRCTEPSILVNARMAMSAIFGILCSSTPDNLQTTRKVSPLFLFAAPWNSSTTPCTISAIWFTNVMTLSWSTSVAMLKSRIRAAPIMHSTRVPSTIASTFALSKTFMLWAMMFAPASPKPRASSEPSLMMVFSRITVSMSSLVDAAGVHITMSQSHWNLFCCCLCAFALCISSNLNSSSATFIAISGSLRKVSTLEIMFSTGCSTSLFASFEKKRDTVTKDRQMNSVVPRENMLSSWTNGRRSK